MASSPEDYDFMILVGQDAKSWEYFMDEIDKTIQKDLNEFIGYEFFSFVANRAIFCHKLDIGFIKTDICAAMKALST